MDARDCLGVYQRAPAVTKAILIEARRTSGPIGCCECPLLPDSRHVGKRPEADVHWSEVKSARALRFQD
jgi:hypothetical protein